MHLDISEIFFSLQGESTFSGLPCAFIRLFGCNLDCTWCDTVYARDKKETLSYDQIMARVAVFNTSLVEITGGEPLIQPDTPALAARLIDQGFQVLVETNGSLDISVLPRACIRIMDIKCPSSNAQDPICWANLDHLTQQDEIKFVVGTRTDYEFAHSVITDRLQGINAKQIHLSPVFGMLDPADLAAWILSDKLKARLSLQQHKLIWGPDKQGV